jgi:hypothetical protein
MAVSTTQSIWRSGGGDNTRQAYCGTGVMAAGFYIANAAVSGNVVIASGSTLPVILPANAVVTSVIITNGLDSGTMNVGYTTIDGATSSAAFYVSALAATSAKTVTPGATGAGTGIGTVASASKNITVTSQSAASAVGDVTGYITYYVTDPLFGQQNS